MKALDRFLDIVIVYMTITIGNHYASKALHEVAHRLDYVSIRECVSMKDASERFPAEAR